MGRHPDNRIEVVDLAARLYPEYVRDGLPGAVCPQFPAFIWNWSDKLPPGVILSPDLDACRTAISDPRYRDYSREMDALATEALDEILAARSKRRSEPKPKVGRNERCPCGSGEEVQTVLSRRPRWHRRWGAIRSGPNIMDVVRASGREGRRTGKHHKVRCPNPQHPDATPSCDVDDDANVFICRRRGRWRRRRVRGTSSASG